MSTPHAHKTILHILSRAISLTEQMITHKDTRLIDYKPLQKLNEEDLALLAKALERMTNLWPTMEAQKQSEDIALDLVATDTNLLKLFALRGAFSVVDIQAFDDTTFIGLLQQCEGMGMRGHQHLYFFHLEK